MKGVELINRAYYLSGIVGRDLDQVQGSEGRDGLFWLNQLLSEKSMNGDYLPYYSHLIVPYVNGQEKYFVPGLITADPIAFNIGDVRYSMRGENRRTYWGNARADNIDSLPYQYYYERVNGGMDIYFYFKPSGITNFTVTGLTALPQVINDTDLSASLDDFYQLFLMFELAEYLCMWNQITLPPKTQQKLDQYRKTLYNMNPMDLRVNKVSIIRAQSALNYAQINIGKAWTTSP